MSGATTARALALDLHELRPEEREALLAELPTERRAELKTLLEEIERLARAPQESFVAHWDRADDDASDDVTVSAGATTHDCRPGIEMLRRLNDGQLRALLANEPPSVRLRILAMLRSSELIELPASLRKAVTDHLVQQWASSGLHMESATQRSRWWQALWRRVS
jgi:flagellar motor switch protein FliG